MVILLKACKPDNFESYNSLKLSLANIWGLGSNFVDVNLSSNHFSWHSCSMWDKPEWLNCSSNFSVRGYLPLIWKDSSTHIHGCAVYVKEGLPFAWDLFLENSADSYLCFNRLYFTQCPISFFSTNYLLCHCGWFLILFHLRPKK